MNTSAALANPEFSTPHASEVHALDELFTALRENVSRVLASGPAVLAFSGGVDSALIAHAASGIAPGFAEVLLLLADRGGRDREFASAASRQLALDLDTDLVTEDELLAEIARSRELLGTLENYTHRILAVCELLLARRALSAIPACTRTACDAAARSDISAGPGLALVTGHGPEAFLGGFRRHARPAPGSLELNRARLSIVARHVGIAIVTPYTEPRVVAALERLAGLGATKRALLGLLPEGFIAPEMKSSLQNGSGVHYLFERYARRAGFSRTRDAMAALLS